MSDAAVSAVTNASSLRRRVLAVPPLSARQTVSRKMGCHAERTHATTPSSRPGRSQILLADGWLFERAHTHNPGQSCPQHDGDSSNARRHTSNSSNDEGCQRRRFEGRSTSKYNCTAAAVSRELSLGWLCNVFTASAPREDILEKHGTCRLRFSRPRVLTGPCCSSVFTSGKRDAPQQSPCPLLTPPIASTLNHGRT